MLTLRERKTRFTLTAPLPSKKAETANEALQETFGPLPSMARQSVTFDNGGEFALHQNLNAELDMQTYFCDPHSPGSEAPSKTPMASSAATCPEKPTSTITVPAISMNSPGPSTQHPENASASKHPLKPSSKTSGVALDL